MSKILKNTMKAAVSGAVLTAFALGLTMSPMPYAGLGDAHAKSAVIKIKKTGPGVSKRIKLGLNKAVVIDLPRNAHDILVADPALADAVTRSSTRIYLFGKTVGQTNIFVFGPSGEEIVAIELEIERDIAGLQQHLARFIPDSNISVEIISDNIVLSGSVRTPQDAARAQNLAQIFLKGGEATTRNITSTSEGGGDTDIFAEARQESQIVNLLTIDGEDQVTLKVTIAEINRQVLKQLGFNSFSRGTSGGSNPVTAVLANDNPFGLGKPLAGNSQSALAGSIGGFNIGSYLNAMEQAGVMRTLAEPNLTAISGEVANFNIGGEFWVVDSQSVDPDTNQVTYSKEKIEYGIALGFAPVVLSAGRISLKISTDVSEPTFEGASTLSGGGSGGSYLTGMTALSIRRRHADTTVEVPSGGSIVIAGLIKDNVRQVMTGLPGASKLPVLGTLFRSRDYIRSETEMVIIATPYLVRPVARQQLARPDDNFNTASDAAASFLGRVNRIYGRKETNLPNGRYHGVVGFIYK